MKDILVEFTDYGAIIHKDPSVIEAKKDLPYCFFNPDLSNVGGVSPSYWVYNEEGQIVMASPEERKRRDEYHENKPPENTVSFKQTMDELLDEVYDDLEKNAKYIEDKVDQIKELIKEDNTELKKADNSLSISLDFVIKSFSDFKELTNFKINKLEKQLTMYKIALIVSTVIALIGAIK